MSELRDVPQWGVHDFGQDGQNGNAWRMTSLMFETSCPPVARSNAMSGFKSREGANPMTKVITLTGPRAGSRVQSPALSPTSIMPPAGRTTLCGVGTLERQAAIENALSMALHFVRQPGDSAANLWAATARVNRALTLLKHANSNASVTGGRV